MVAPPDGVSLQSMTTLGGLAAVVGVGASVIVRATRPATGTARRAGLGVHCGAVKGRLWTVLNPAARLDLFAEGLVLTPGLFPRQVILRSQVVDVLRVEDGRSSGKRRGQATLIRWGSRPRQVAVECADVDHETLRVWFCGKVH